MNIKTLAYLLLAVLLAVGGPALADGIDGKWPGTIDTPNGPVRVAYSFKAMGEQLTGSSADPMERSGRSPTARSSATTCRSRLQWISVWGQ